jgi:hypothetical protein
MFGWWKFKGIGVIDNGNVMPVTVLVCEIIYLFSRFVDIGPSKLALNHYTSKLSFVNLAAATLSSLVITTMTGPSGGIRLARFGRVEDVRYKSRFLVLPFQFF